MFELFRTGFLNMEKHSYSKGVMISNSWWFLMQVQYHLPWAVILSSKISTSVSHTRVINTSLINVELTILGHIIRPLTLLNVFFFLLLSNNYFVNETWKWSKRLVALYGQIFTDIVYGDNEISRSRASSWTSVVHRSLIREVDDTFCLVWLIRLTEDAYDKEWMWKCPSMRPDIFFMTPELDWEQIWFVF